MDLFDLASQLFPSSPRVGSTTPTVMGTATGSSSSGAVEITMGSDVTNPDPVEIDGEVYYGDADTSIEIPTSPSVQEGDDVLVALVGDGPLKTPVVIGAAGSGDRTEAKAAEAWDKADSVEGIAQQALDVANAVGQHFWYSDAGAYVTEQTREQFEQDPSGPNSLWNSLGMLFRDGLMNLLALLPGQTTTETFTVSSSRGELFELQAFAQSIESVTINGTPTTRYGYKKDAAAGYSAINLFITAGAQEGDTLAVTYRAESSVALFDGSGNDASNIVASFSNSVIELARNSINTAIRMLGGRAVISAEDMGYGDGAVSMSIGAIGSVGIGAETATDAYPLAGAASTVNAYVPSFSSYAENRAAHLVTYNDKSTEVSGECESGSPSRVRIGTDYYYLGGGGGSSHPETYGALLQLESERGGTSTLALGYRDASDTYTYEEFAISDVIAALKKVPEIGRRYQASGSVAINQANTDISGPSITVPAGNYLVTVIYGFPTGAASGVRDTTLGFKAGGSSTYTKVMQGSNASVRLTHFDAWSPTESQTFTAYVRSSTTSSAGNCYISAIRLN